MEPNVYVVQVRVYTSEMMRFFNDDPAYGTKEKPYPADSFSEIISPYATFYGPLKNIILFQNNSVYQWKLESSDGRPLAFSSTKSDQGMELEMITDKPSDKKWKKIFKNAPAMQADGKVKVKSKESGKNVFELETTDDVAGGGGLKYSFLVEFDHNGKTLYAMIDPYGRTYPPPPPGG
jgi:hypothetical protein